MVLRFDTYRVIYTETRVPPCTHTCNGLLIDLLFVVQEFKNTSLFNRCAKRRARFWSQDGQHALCRHEKATKNSVWQSGHRTRATSQKGYNSSTAESRKSLRSRSEADNPSLRSPHLRNLLIEERITGLQYPYFA